ncbi:glycoside hydrolase family 16 protein [Algoriphagus boseongensis]|nr:glycoside hydrolase family 16 protein [Algoriphagus boseongensis]
MKNRMNFLFIATCLSLSCCVSDEDGTPDSGQGSTITIPTTGFNTPTSYDGMTLVWEDNFDGNALNEANWTHEVGNGQNGWGNNELQYYRPQNTTLQQGNLIITAKKESFGGKEYTSSRIITKDKKQFRYGRIDIRAVLPKGQGIWPALWMLGSNFSTVGWPACGEIDIMEMVGGQGRENTVHGTVHWEHDGSRAEFGGNYKLSSGTFSDEFHVFSIVWDAQSIRWLVDNKQYHVIDTQPAQLDEFRRNFFFIFNVAVGGNWPGSPDATSTYPQHMIVDFVRVFQSN